MLNNLHSLTIEDLIQIIIKQDERIKKLEEENIELKRQIKLLMKNSSNSSKPPSSDMGNGNNGSGGNGVKKNQSLRGKSGKKSGGQNGHKGTVHKFTSNPDTIIECNPASCNKCGKSLQDKEGEVMEIRQETDIPQIKPRITEFQKIQKECSCGCINQGEFPEHIKAPMQIGNNAKSFMIYLNVAHLIPYKRLTQIARDLFGFSISQGSIDNIIGYAYDKGKPLHKIIMNMIKSESWVGSDETGVKIEGKRWWQWVWQNLTGSYYIVDKRRGYDVVKENFAEDYIGKLVHDCWSAHNNTTAKGGHQHCHPHYQRDLEFLENGYKSLWAYKAHCLLIASQKARDHIWKDDFDINLRNKIILEYEKKLTQIITHPVKLKEEITLQKRFKKHRDKILLFMHSKDMPFHNNDSEKAIRNAKVKQKVSGGFRSREGAEKYCVLLSIIETCKKQNLNILDSIRKIFTGDFSFG